MNGRGLLLLNEDMIADRVGSVEHGVLIHHELHSRLQLAVTEQMKRLQDIARNGLIAKNWMTE